MESRWEAANTYNLILTRRNASEILLLPKGTGWELPRIAIHPRRRIAEQLTTEVANIWGIVAYCLSVRCHPKSSEVKGGNCALMESVRHNDEASAGTCWTPRTSAADCIDTIEARLLQESLEELDAYKQGKMPGPFARPGWLRELFLWAQEQLAFMGLRLTGGFRQLNASPTFSLIRLESNVGAVWFKATGEPNAHEFPVTVALAQNFPRFVPRLLGVHRAWNGWLAEEVAGASLDAINDWSAWEQAAETLAELQVASIGKCSDLLKTQLKDLRIPKLAKRIDPFLARMRDLMASQEKQTPAPLVESELRTLAEGLKEACALLASLGLPDTVGHIDFNPGNILVSADRCVFLDWAEGCVTNPMVTFEYLAEHMSRATPKAPATREQLAFAYLRTWTSFYSPELLRRTFAISPLLAVFAYAVAGETWRSPEIIHDSILAGYFRSLTRRMYREALYAAVGSEPCLD